MSTAYLPVATDSFEHYMVQINRFQLLEPEEEHALAKRYYEDEDLDAAHKLITANLRFVVKVAHEYRAYGMKMLDLVQEGNIGLMMAVKKFDPEHGTRLITYAVWWIRAYIHNYIIRTWSLVKIGTTQAQKKLFFKLRQTRDAIRRISGNTSDTGNPEETSAIADELEVRDDEVESMALRMSARDTSLDVQIKDNENHSLLDTLTDNRASQEDLLLHHEKTLLLTSQVDASLKKLNPREQQIIQQRILSENPKTLQELADHFGVSRERIRQLEKNALRKMKEVLEPGLPADILT